MEEEYKTINSEIESMLEDDVLQIDNDENINDVQQYTTNVYRGKAMNDIELYRFSASNDIRIILVFGPVHCGKTTMEVMIYSMFIDEKYSNLKFAGSRTLLGFEERIKTLRLSSGNKDADVARTIKDNPDRYLQLEIKANNEKKNLIMADISGEEYKSCLSNTQLAIEKYSMFAGNNIFVFVLDGESISKKNLRGKVVRDNEIFMRTLFEAKIIDKYSNIDIVISKYDKVLESNSETNKEFIKRNIDKLLLEYKDKLGMIRIHRIAALCSNTNIEEYYGLDDLLTTWWKDDLSYAQYNEKTINRFQYEVNNQFDMFKFKVDN